MQGLAPDKWAVHVRRVYRKHEAHALIAEINQGGELVREIVQRDAEDIVFEPVRAIAGKLLRAGALVWREAVIIVSAMA